MQTKYLQEKVKKNKQEYGGKQKLLSNQKKSVKIDKGKEKENAIEINFELLGRDSEFQIVSYEFFLQIKQIYIESSVLYRKNAVEDLDDIKKNEKEKNQSYVNITIGSPIMHLSTTSINSLFLFFSDDPDFLNKKLMNTSRKTLLKCLLKYGDIDRLLLQKKGKNR